MKPISKKLPVHLVVILAGIFGSCEETTNKENQFSSRAVVVINDNSASISNSMDSSGVAKRQQWVKTFLLEQMDVESDVILLPINSASHSVVSHELYKWEYQDVQEQGGVKSEVEQMLETSAKESEDFLQRDRIIDDVLSSLSGSEKGSNQSLIIETAVELSRLAGPYTEVEVLIVSDCVQESQLLDFTATPMTSRADAIALGKSSAEKLMNLYGLNSTSLRNIVSLDVIVPSNANSQMLVFGNFFYSSFFKTLGVEKVEINWSSGQL